MYIRIDYLKDHIVCLRMVGNISVCMFLIIGYHKMVDKLINRLQNGTYKISGVYTYLIQTNVAIES